uniref:Uncharacterized protein n=1 Tax=Xiphophorus couchianus TaxID=32473 RepID=A0A3B5MM59_9TELE
MIKTNYDNILLLSKEFLAIHLLYAELADYNVFNKLLNRMFNNENKQQKFWNFLFSFLKAMKMIDRQYENSSLGEDKMFPLQSKLAAYKKEIEAQKEAEMNTKLKHFKDVEIAKVRMDEKAKFNQELEKLKQELERTYEMRAKALMDREKNAIERLQKQQEIEEKNVYMQRQLLLKEIETLRSRENELRMRTEVELETAQQQISLLTQQKELLKERLESTSDYSRLKLEKTELLGQLQLLKKQLEEAQGENQRLRAGEGRPPHF